jgi:hypothetical protein
MPRHQEVEVLDMKLYIVYHALTVDKRVSPF